MNYVIINGRKSTLIKGLLISELPPITKPQMRTTLEELDGRDGDVVNKLGYKAYNKSMQIGLFGDFDIDQVIEYFNTEGTIIFSNEPDKFYYFDQISGIEFDRLIKFKTAKVIFHVQPFKFSAVDDWFEATKNQMVIRNFSEVKASASITAINGVVTVSGTSSGAGDVYIPIKPMPLKKEEYTLKINVSGTGASACRIRVIGENPTDEDSFGGTYLQVSDGATLTATLTAEKTFNYLWLSITSIATMDFEMTVEMLADELDSVTVFNRGNTSSRPKLTIYGEGNITLSVNGVQLFSITLGSEEYITIDALQMNAYKGDALKNRLVSGDYSKLILNTGANTISWTGNISKIDVENVSRWI